MRVQAGTIQLADAGNSILRVYFETEIDGSESWACDKIPRHIDGYLHRIVISCRSNSLSGNYDVRLLDQFGADILEGGGCNATINADCNLNPGIETGDGPSALLLAGPLWLEVQRASADVIIGMIELHITDTDIVR